MYTCACLHCSDVTSAGVVIMPLLCWILHALGCTPVTEHLSLSIHCRMLAVH